MLSKTINECIKELHENIANGMDEYADGDFYDVVHQVYPINLTEGLIDTYPAELVVKTIGNLYNLYPVVENNALGVIKIKEKSNKETVIDIVLYSYDEKTATGIRKHFLKYGYFLSLEDVPAVGKSARLRFEKRFGDRFTKKNIKTKTTTLYHVAPAKSVEKILRQGLTPRQERTYNNSKENGDMEKVYLYLEHPDASDLTYFQWRFGDIAIFEIDVDKLQDNISFFYDPRLNKAMFTYEPITPQAIKLEQIIKK